MAGQLHPVGSRYSPNWYGVALCNWARWHGCSLRPFGWAGLSVSAHALHGHAAFIIDQRGPGFARVRAEFPFCSREERRGAFAVAMQVYAALNPEGSDHAG